MKENKFETNSTVYRRVRRIRIAKETGGCDRCPAHGGENARLKGKRPRDDRHKNHRRK